MMGKFFAHSHSQGKRISISLGDSSGSVQSKTQWQYWGGANVIYAFFPTSACELINLLRIPYFPTQVP